MTEQLPADTRMSQVALDVADLDLMTRFYSEVLLLEPVGQGAGTVGLGRGGQQLVVLRHRPDLRRGERRSAGLFHTALLHPDAGMLATVLASVATRTPELYTGSGDHLVSQAFYLDDPEGNGVELYVDRPRDQWTWNGSQVAMDTLYLDPNAFLSDHLTDEARNFLETAPDHRPALAGSEAQVVGHVHLKVGQTAKAKDFYVDTLGFDVTAELPGALFVSAGGYHHHMAMNTWGTAGVGLACARPRPRPGGDRGSGRRQRAGRRPPAHRPWASRRAGVGPAVGPAERRGPVGQPRHGGDPDLRLSPYRRPEGTGCAHQGSRRSPTACSRSSSRSWCSSCSVPEGHEWTDVLAIWPKLISYLISFVYVGIYWNNHHHLFQLGRAGERFRPVGEPAPAVLAVTVPVRDGLGR